MDKHSRLYADLLEPYTPCGITAGVIADFPGSVRRFLQMHRQK